MEAALLIRELEKTRMDGAVLGSGHVDYDDHRRVWNAIADRRPAAIVRAQNVRDVTKTIAIAAKREVLLAVRSGGHSLPGLSTCDNGIVLDLSAMNEVVVDPVARTAEVGGGALLQHLDAAGSRARLATPAGLVSHTGVAGLTLGGGMGWLSRRFGLTIDNLLAADVVTADGQLIQASADTEPDLFWGIRGGGGNFGVVTKFRFRMHSLGQVVVGIWEYQTSDCQGALRGYQELARNAPRELTTSFTLTSSSLVVTAVWSGSSDRADTILAPFGRLGRAVSGSHSSMAYVDLQKRNDDHLCWGRRCYAKGGYFSEINSNMIECMKDSIASSPSPDSEIYVMQLGGAIADVAESATAYSGREASYYWIADSIWDDKTDDPRCIAWARSTAARLAALSLSGNYVNEQADAGKDVAFSAYGAEKYRKLARLKARFDPTNLFRLNQNIEPKP